MTEDLGEAKEAQAHKDQKKIRGDKGDEGLTGPIGGPGPQGPNGDNGYQDIVYRLMGDISNYVVVHSDSSLVNTATMTKVLHDTKFEVTVKKDLPHGLYAYDSEITSNFTNGFNIYMYGECGGAGFYAKTMYRYWAANYAGGDDFNPVKQGASGNGVHGGYFLRAVGRKVQIQGVFHNFGDSVRNLGNLFP